MSDFSAAIRKLEFEKIVRRITHLASTDPGKDLAQSIRPLRDRSKVEHELARVSEMKTLLVSEQPLPLDGIKNIVPHVKKSGVENQFLSAAELLDVAGVLRASREVLGFLGKRKSQYPRLAEFLPRLVADKVVEFNIQEAIDEGGRVRDTASRELSMIRSDMITVSGQLRKRLSAILRQISEQDYTQDDIITTRDGRFVIPVKTEFKHRVPGFIHSTSASGATVFIEPAETLDLNNALRELQFREQREIEHLLRTLTSQVRELGEALLLAASTLAVLDCLAARARYSIEILGNAPRISANPGLLLKEARHPVLLQRHPRDEVVPLDLELGTNGVYTLLITGPNAGGKSVALTTVGLLCLCVQSGLHIPASPDSEVFVFDNIFVDIGDNQSLDNDLSTFSSHLMNIKEILTHASGGSLVLIDEIGAGTDPAEGGALASAVLKRLNSRKVLTIATTHHGALKAFAHEQPGIANGSMEFDGASLAPTYRFRFGIPGSSYALELARRMGVEEDLLTEARERLGDEKSRLETLIAALDRDIQEYREKLRAVETERTALEEMTRTYERKLAEVRTEIRLMKHQAGEEARELVRKAQATIEQVIKDIRESSADRAVIKAAKDRIRSVERDTAVHPGTEESEEQFQVGDLVTLRDGTEAGEIVSLNNREATVLWKSGTLKTPINRLRKTKKRPGSTAQPAAYQLPDAKSELDLRGLTGDEALQQVERFLDQAFMAGLHRVDIIHGKGTGALRKKIAGFLATYPHIRDFRLGEWNEGGTGVTVVELAGDVS